MIHALYCGERQQDWLLARAFLSDECPFGSSIGLEWARSAESARAAIRDQSYDVLLVDSSIGGGLGTSLLAEAASLLIRTPILLLVPDESALSLMPQAFGLGAADVLVRSRVSPAEFRWAIEKAHRRAEPPGYRAAEGLGVLSRPATFRDRIDRAVSRAERSGRSIAVLSISVRGVRDGHQGVSTDVVERVRRSVRSTDSLCRLGDDCLMALVEDLEDVVQVEGVVARIRRAIDLGGQGQDVEIGVGRYPEDAGDAAGLVETARRALDEAILASPDRSSFESRPTSRQVVRRAGLERALRRDLERMEFEVHYQPRLDLRTSAVVGVEALLRYSPYDLGHVGAAEVVPILESMDEIERVGEWVLREACAASAEWEREGHPLVVGVNVSACQLQPGRLDRAIERILEDTGASPGLLELELTEGVLIENTASTRCLITALRSRGVRIAVDDFGTGYASLSYVKHFPMDAIKIDREFVRGLPRDPENVAITASIIALAHRLGIEVVAEGVESVEEEAFLREHRCDYLQGYLRARPMPRASIKPWLEARPVSPSGICFPTPIDSKVEVG